MDPFIVFFGAHHEITYARDLAHALQKARAYGMAEGMSAEAAGDPDEVFARVYDFYLARDLGLAWLDQRETGWYVAEARP